MTTMTPGARFRAALGEEKPLQVPGAICAYHATLAKAYDPYGFVRDAFLQRRLYLVYDGNPPEQLMEDPLEDQPPD